MSGRVDLRPEDRTIEVVEGDDITISITKEDIDGNAQDITGWEFWLTVKETPRDTDSDALFQKSVTSHIAPQSGETQLDIDPPDTKGMDGEYHYDMQYKDAANEITTFLRGTFAVANEITRGA